MTFNWININILQEAFSILVNNEFLSDVKFQFPDGGIIFAHSFILCLRSINFYDNFKENIGVSKILNVNEFSRIIFLNFLTYLYTDKIDINEKNVTELMKLSLHYNIKPLEIKCSEFMTKNITSNTACKILNDSIMQKCEVLIKLCLDFISNNYLSVLKSDFFVDVNDKTLESILKLDLVSDTNEYNIFKYVILWAGRSCEKDGIESSGKNCRKQLGDNFKLIRFNSMTTQELANCHTLAPGFMSETEIGSILISIVSHTENSSAVARRSILLRENSDHESILPKLSFNKEFADALAKCSNR